MCFYSDYFFRLFTHDARRTPKVTPSVHHQVNTEDAMDTESFIQQIDQDTKSTSLPISVTTVWLDGNDTTGNQFQQPSWQVGKSTDLRNRASYSRSVELFLHTERRMKVWGRGGEDETADLCVTRSIYLSPTGGSRIFTDCTDLSTVGGEIMNRRISFAPKQWFSSHGTCTANSTWAPSNGTQGDSH